MAPPQLINFKEFIIQLPDRRKVTVQQVTPLTNDDYTVIPAPAEHGSDASLVAFAATGGTITSSFYTNLFEDRVTITNQKGNKVITATISEVGRLNYSPKRS